MEHYNEYVDSRGWHYRAMPLIGGQPYALCYQRTPGGGWHRMKQMMLRMTLAEAKQNLDEYAAKKGWTGLTNYMGGNQ